jgi:hypothetical protein
VIEEKAHIRHTVGDPAFHPVQPFARRSPPPCASTPARRLQNDLVL